MRPLLRNVAALAVLTLVAGATLAWFAQLTEDEVARNRLEAETRIFRELAGVELDAFGDGDLVLCERGLVVLRVAGAGYGGGFRLAVALDLDGSIQGVRVLEHAETPGFGDILNAPSTWLDSFATGDVHAVTGATITSDAVKAAVERAVQRARAEEMCTAGNEPVGDGLVPSRRALRVRIENAPHSASNRRKPRATRYGRPQGPSGRPQGSSGRPQGSPLRGARSGREPAWNKSVPCCLAVGAALPARPGGRVP